LFKSGSFKLAASEYERIFYDTDNANIKNIALIDKSFCYKQDKQFDNAAKTLKRIDFNKVNDSLYAVVYYEYALNTFLNGDYKETLLQLNEMKAKNIDTLKNEYLILKILTLNELKKWDEANTTFNNYIKINSIIVDPKIYNELLKKPRLKNEKFAKGISYLIPGFGQIYTGHWGRGLSSLFFNSAFIAYTYVSLINGFYFSGVFSGFSGFRMFWTGGASYAEYLAKQKNKESITKHNKKVKDFILLNNNKNNNFLFIVLYTERITYKIYCSVG